MWKNASLCTGFTLLLIGAAIFTHMDFLLPYKRVLFRQHGQQMAIFAALVGVNLYALYFWLTAKLFLKRSGVKLRHVDKQIRDGSIAEELTARLRME